jgi:CheY-like chemotaxis protein
MSTILLVDDNTKSLRFLSTVLQMCGYSILNAADSEQALVVARQTHYDLLLMTSGLPYSGKASLAGSFRLVNPTRPIVVYAGVRAMPPNDPSEINGYVAGCHSIDILLRVIKLLIRLGSAPCGQTAAIRTSATAAPLLSRGITDVVAALLLV